MADGKSKRRNKANIHTEEKIEDSTIELKNLLEEITRKYAAEKEEDIDINEIYRDRENRTDRDIFNGV